MASAPAKNTNKDRTKPPRLGRGLSSLIGGPVRIDPAPAVDAPSVPSDKNTAQPAEARQQGGTGGSEDTGGAGGAASTPEQTSPAPTADAFPPAEPFEGVPGASSGDGQILGRRQLRYLPLNSITPSPYQPRAVIAQDALQDLASSIRSSGVMQPIVVRPRDVPLGDVRFELIAGERRWRASLLAGLERIPAVLVDVDDRTAAEWALIENIQREDLNPVDRARGFRILAENFDLTHAQVAERVGLDRATVANAIRITELETPILDMLARNELSAGHGKALLAAAPGASRAALARKALDENWSVRTLEHHIRAATIDRAPPAPSAPSPKKERSAQIVALEKQLSEHLSTKVRIKARAGANKGRVEIDFYDLDHFDALMDKLGFDPQ